MNMKKIISSTLIASMLLGSSVCSVMALEENSVDKGESKIVAEVFDYGESVTSVVVDLGSVISADELKEDAFEVFAKNEEPEACIGISTGKTYYEGSRDITNMYVNSTSIPDGEADAEGQYVVIELKYGWKEYVDGVLTTVKQSNTCDYDIVMKDGAFSIFESLNVLLDMHYTITSNQNLGNLKQGDQILLTNDDVYRPIAGQFSAGKSNGLTYRLYEPTLGEGERPLIVWFHGNGEGDYKGSQNNVAQLLANRGTVAWATDEAQEIFGKAHVMSFQAPDTWYYAQKDGLLEKAYNEIQEVISKKGIDPKKVYVSGCSAGGYMTTRMLIKYPNLFKAAMINCPALDVATKRGGETPTDEELASLKNSPTAIWLVQGATDGTVNTEDCSKRLFKALTDGQELVESRHEQELDSDFTTTETKDGKYKISLYDTTEAGKLQFGEDFDQDDVKTLVEFSNHWSWIYTLNNNPESADGTSIWKWAANYNVTDTSTKTDDKTDNTQKPSQPTTDKTTNSVKTGDNTVMSSYAIMMLLAAGAYTAIKKTAE
mgnify:CR=1 FL=1